MNILLLEQDYLKSSNKRAHSACHSVQIARLMQKYTNNKVYILANPDSALLLCANKHKIQCLAEPIGMFSSLKFALLLKKYKIDIVHTFDLLSATLAVKALSFASSVRHIHSENRNTEKEDMLLGSAFKKVDACIFAHKSYEGQYKFKYIYQENHRAIDFYIANIFPCVDMEQGDGNVISLEEIDIITAVDSDKKGQDSVEMPQINLSQEHEQIAHDTTLLEALESKQSSLSSSSATIKEVYAQKAKQDKLDRVLSSKYPKFLPYDQSKKKIRFLVPYSPSLLDLDTLTDALRCFHEYEGHIYKWEAYFIGPDVDFEKILKYAKKYEIQDNIAIFKKDLDQENYEKSEICIVSTFKDEYNLEALFEAWAQSKPTIITQRMPYYEKALNGKNVLSPDLDTALSLSSVMHKAVQDVECRASMIEYTLAMDFEKMAKETAKTYDSLYAEVKKKKRV